MKLLDSFCRRPLARNALGLLAVVLVCGLLASPAVLAADASEEVDRQHATPVSLPGWTQVLKGQTIVEEAIEGMPGRSAKVELQHHRLMRRMEQQMQQDAQAQVTSGGYNAMSMMHQYMGQDGASWLLVSDNVTEPVAANGGRCPSSAPVKQYDISMIEIEVTLNQWLDYYPGYMYILTENIDKARAEEARNEEARGKEDGEWDPGAVSNGLQGDWIQPLAIRANQGDCVRLTVRNKMEFDTCS